MIRITFEAADRESLINSIAQFMLDENYTRPDPVIIHPEVGEPEADEPASEAPKADEQPECSISKEDMRQVLLSVRGAHGSAGLRSLLNRFNASNLDELDPKDYPTIVTAATEMLKEANNNG